MGGEISINGYDIIEFQFYAYFWKVYSGIRKLTGEKVSLWILDQELLPTKGVSSLRKNYIKSCFDSIKQMRKIRHPHILKVIDFNEKLKVPAFVSEPIVTCLSKCKLENHEIGYISHQLCQTLIFLHQEAKIVHFDIRPANICLTSNFDIKLCGFNFSSPIIAKTPAEIPTTIVKPLYNKWSPSPFSRSLAFPQEQSTASRVCRPMPSFWQALRENNSQGQNPKDDDKGTRFPS